MVNCTSEYLSLSFNSYQLVACHCISPTSLSTGCTLDYLEANPTHHVLSSANTSECISRKISTLFKGKAIIPFSHKNFKVNTKDKKLKQTALQTRNRESHQGTTSQSSF